MQRSEESVKKYGRALEKVIFDRHFGEGNDMRILDELTAYQNFDGGFGNGLESDFRLPYSSPMATSVGVRYLKGIEGLEDAKGHMKAAIEYFEAMFDKGRNGWFAVPKGVNLFPHAPWWHFNEEEGMTVIDKNWGNPSAEITAYLYKYREYVEELDVDGLVKYAIERLREKKQFESENEIYCYLELYEALPEETAGELEELLEAAIPELIVYDRARWTEYVPLPLDFVKGPDANRFGIPEASVEENLDFLVDLLEKDGKILPPWGESFYKGDLKPAYNEWIGCLTLKALLDLQKFGRIEE